MYKCWHVDFDALGSTVAMTDAAGAVVNKYAYGVFGQVIDGEEQVENPFKYVGAFGVMDEGNGTYYMRARYYDPEAGRFISKDPIGLEGGINMYAYVGGNPLNYVDPLGLFSPGDAMYGKYMMDIGAKAGQITDEDIYDFFGGRCKYYCNFLAPSMPCLGFGAAVGTITTPVGGILTGLGYRASFWVACDQICPDEDEDSGKCDIDTGGFDTEVQTLLQSGG
jgi:RHS repeat-associated protein